jgi:NADPH:quinone reductase
MVEAAAIPETIVHRLDQPVRARLARRGRYVLVHGGTSGIGTMAIALGDCSG